MITVGTLDVRKFIELCARDRLNLGQGEKVFPKRLKRGYRTRRLQIGFQLRLAVDLLQDFFKMPGRQVFLAHDCFLQVVNIKLS